VFDIDGTILDLRHLTAHVLLDFDRSRRTEHFRGLVADDITHHEDRIEDILESLDVPLEIRMDVVDFYRGNLWTREAMLAASRPFEGVFGVIRWFQVQPRTSVVLNTGRAHRLREDTLESLNVIAAAYRVRFTPGSLFTAPDDGDVPSSKVAAIAEMRRRGLRVVAVVDNEPENLEAMAAADPHGEVLFLHADTVFESQRLHHDRLVAGREYRLRDLVPERTFPGRVEFVWHGVNDAKNLARFLSSDVRWAEVDVRHDPIGRLTLRHDGFDETPWHRTEALLHAGDAVRRLADSGRSVKLDLKEGASTVSEVIDLVDRAGLTDDRLWFNAELATLGRRRFQALRARFPRAVISCPVDFLVPILLASPAAADHLLAMLSAWGISRLSFLWGPPVPRLIDRLEARGWQVNLYGIPDLEAFLHASLLLPTSVTADFNFPEWRYFGHGSGAEGAVHELASRLG